ncbi:hypothetical protein JCM15519_20990 [Fundidesulfovibrio butyratiphilus]
MGKLKPRFKPAKIIGAPKVMEEVFALITKVAKTNTTVLLLGESGVGKEMIADAIHGEGVAPGGPMVKFNCAALPESILESELFGHEKGSFTGASQARKGRFEEANGGTIFLDEVRNYPKAPGTAHQEIRHSLQVVSRSEMTGRGQPRP